MTKRKEKKGRTPFRQLFVQLLEKELEGQLLTDFDSETVAAFTGEENVTPSQVMTVTMLQKAMKGDAKAFEFIRDMVGEKPKDNKEPLPREFPKIQVKRMTEKR